MNPRKAFIVENDLNLRIGKNVRMRKNGSQAKQENQT